MTGNSFLRKVNDVDNNDDNDDDNDNNDDRLTEAAAEVDRSDGRV